MTYEPAPPSRPYPSPPPVRQARSRRSGLWLLGLLALVGVFVAGLLIGQSGLFGTSGVGLAPADTPITTPGTTPPADSPTVSPSPADGTSPRATEPPGDSATPSLTPAPPVETPLPLVTPAPGATPGEAADVPENFGLFWEALEIIRREYVGREDLTDRQVTYGAIEGLVEALGDTGHSVFLTPEQLQAERQSLSGTIVGVGALLGERGGRPIIVSVISGGPADRAGLRSGDAFVSVDGEDVQGLQPAEIATRVRGEEGTTVEIVVDRPETGERLTFNIEREEIRIPAASWAMVPGTNIAVLRLIQFSEGAGDELERAREEALAAGAEAFILDLRSNPGGFVHEARHVASLFVEEGTVYIRELASGEQIPVEVEPDVEASELPLVVLIDEGTASSAEIVAGAIAAAERGVLVGATTFGTGTVLLTYELSDGSAVRLAIERWLTPEGELIFGQGITPGEEIELAPDDRAVEPDELRDMEPGAVPTLPDPQLQRAIDLLTT